MTAIIDPKQFLDPRWRLSNLYWITDKEGREVKFEPNEAQLQFLSETTALNIILKARQLGFCVDPKTRILTAELKWVAIEDLSVGQEIIGVDEFGAGGKGQHRKMRTAKVEAVARVHRKAYRIVFDDGREVVCTDRHPWMTRKAHVDARWRSISGKGNHVVGRIKVGTQIRWIAKPWGDSSVEDGWFGGILDGEGSMAKDTESAGVCVAQRPGSVWDRMEEYLRTRGYSYRIEDDKGSRPSKFGKVPVPKLCIGRQDELFRLLGQTRPTRFINRRFWEGRELPGKKSGIGWSTVSSIEEIGEQTMIDLQTSTGTYIAEGFVSHNTTLGCLVLLDAAVFNPNTRAGVIAHKMDDAKVIFRDKIQFPYSRLPEQIRERVSAVQDSVDTLTFSNNSSIRVSTSMRSGTLQYLHISEFGKICAMYPDKAKEIVTGALNAVAPGQFVAIESTAEGQDGPFYAMTQKAIALKESGKPLTDLDYSFHFYPWYLDKTYRINPSTIVITEEDERYFDSLEAEGIALDDWQKAWYVKKQETQAGDMKREFPSTPKEAFEQALEGAYFSVEMAAANKAGRIGSFPVDPRYPVNTFWDLGRNDLNTIWLHQYIRGFHRFVGYYENSGEHISHYITWLNDWRAKHGIQFGEHYLPHDGDRQSLWLPEGTMAVMANLKFHPNIVERASNKIQQINQARPFFHRCQFDEAACAVGLKRLKAYRKEWDDRRGVWKDRPLHDINSHGADSFLTFTSSGFTEDEITVQAKARDRHRERFNNRGGGEESWLTA